MLNYKTYKPNAKKADLLIRRAMRESGLYHLLENAKNHAEKCRSNGLIDEYITAIANVDQIEITIEDLEGE